MQDEGNQGTVAKHNALIAFGTSFTNVPTLSHFFHINLFSLPI